MAAAIFLGLLGTAAMMGLEFFSAPAALKPVPIRTERPPNTSKQ